MPVTYRWTSIPSPLGNLLVAESGGVPLVVEFSRVTGRMRWVERLRARHPDATIEVGACPILTTWLDGYFRGEPAPIAFPEQLPDHLETSAAEVAVWRQLSTIALGETCTYNDVARATGLNPRLVGQLVGANPLALYLPCHRVVGQGGKLVGYGGGLDRKRWLLDHELRIGGLALGGPAGFLTTPVST